MMESYRLYGQLRDRCLRFWDLHPDASGSVADLWNRLSADLAEASASSLFGAAADLIDVQRRELEAARRVIDKLMPKLHVEGLTVDAALQSEIDATSTTRGSK